jgi:hypothetical protein
MAVVKQFNMECEITSKSYGKLAEYKKELANIVNYLIKKIGTSWRRIKNSKADVKWLGKDILPSELPWNKINTAINDFDK